jgi:antitoxin (DNA-binding transcriptional repressor) of toxin-antitoxin stability system
VKTVTLTELRKHTSVLFSDVEKGGTLLVLRHGKPVAEISPPSAGRAALSWKRPGLHLIADGASLSSAILEERRRGDIS